LKNEKKKIRKRKKCRAKRRRLSGQFSLQQAQGRRYKEEKHEKKNMKRKTEKLKYSCSGAGG
jgi:hypothetical protein